MKFGRLARLHCCDSLLDFVLTGSGPGMRASPSGNDLGQSRCVARNLAGGIPVSSCSRPHQFGDLQ